MLIVLCGFSLLGIAQTKRLKVSVNYLPALEKHLSGYDLNVFVVDSNNNQRTIRIPKDTTVLIDSVADSITLFFVCHAYCDSAEKEFIEYIPSLKFVKDSIMSLTITFPLDCDYNNHAFNNICPKCKKNNHVIPILYGHRLPIYNEKGEIVKDDPYKSKGGGPEDCLMMGCCASWYCEKDRFRF